ncbi:MAG TPA: tRNA 2-thiouridine(34) synthase MnmA [Syntrophorhabdaceae bacterium]|nr:tRNA 2-thiouridine(34) synthase MnmA [Syntrophorhabdaceae bacterium]HPU30243.1 tRNA 2-thiouridine(34) synthase MnmA [Syntrophorhabdaceae bacterium]
MKKTVAVGLSGGVDSAVCALLLLKKGFNVIAVTMSIWDEKGPYKPLKKGCYGPIESKRIEDAEKVASILNIKHFVIDLKNEFKDLVLDYFIDEYNSGRTPNPCIVCNYKIKFSSLIEKLQKNGIDFDFFATGHYVRIFFDEKNKRYVLKRAIDTTKDQSYFLYRLTQKQLGQLLFPLGDYTKEEVKRIAIESGLNDFVKKPESQDFGRFDFQYMENKYGCGNIIDIYGKILGMHKGINQYTIGQRKGLNLKGMKKPHYVIKIDPIKNEITVGTKENLMGSELVAYDTNWIIPFEEIANKQIYGQIRYKSRAGYCVIHPLSYDFYKVTFTTPQEAITPGQSIVFYDNDILLGGGIIK